MALYIVYGGTHHILPWFGMHITTVQNTERVVKMFHLIPRRLNIKLTQFVITIEFDKWTYLSTFLQLPACRSGADCSQGMWYLFWGDLGIMCELFMRHDQCFIMSLGFGRCMRCLGHITIHARHHRMPSCPRPAGASTLGHMHTTLRHPIFPSGKALFPQQQ